MRSTFSGFNIGYRALAAQQRALDVTSHNIANANTPGYTRQGVIMEATQPDEVLTGFVGTGVTITDFRRIRDEFLDIQMRTENKALGEWETRDNLISKLEVIFNEPSESSLRSVLDEYWESWQTLSRNPESLSARTDVMQRGVTLANTFNHLDAQFEELQIDINKGIALKVEEINTQARQIRDLNIQIIKAESGGMKTANDLRDKRDMLVEALAKNIAIDVVEDEFGAINVTVGGKILVSRSVLGEIRFINNDPLRPETATLEWYEPTHNVSQGPVNLYGGALKGYLDMRDEVIPNYQEKVSTLARTIAEEVNTLHRAGYALDKSTGRDFFVISDLSADFNAQNIRVNLDLVADVNLIAAAGGTVDPADPTGPLLVYEGDNTNATAIALLKNKLTLNGGTASFDDYYTSLIGQLGVQGQETSQMLANKTYIIEQLNNRRDAISGVSLDEEMTNMIKYQHAYNAAARVINVMDEMMEILVNKLGMAGR